MKKMFILGMTVLILSLAFVGCDDGGGGSSGSGGLTVTGLDTYDGKYAYASGGKNDGSLLLVGISSSKKAALIKDGSVVLTVYNQSTQKVYDGSDAVVFSVVIYENEVAVGPSMGTPVTTCGLSVTFDKGKASGAATF